MGSSASIAGSAAKKEEISAEDLQRKQEIISNKKRLTVNDIRDLCQIEEHQDPSKHIFYVQIFNTLKEWDNTVSTWRGDCVISVAPLSFISNSR